MAAKKKHAPSVLLTDEENDTVREVLGQKKYVSIVFGMVFAHFGAILQNAYKHILNQSNTRLKSLRTTVRTK